MISRMRTSSRRPALDEAPALRPVAERAQLPPRQPAEAGEQAGLEPAPRLGDPGQRRLLDRAADAGDAVPPRDRLHRASDRGQKAEVVVGVEVVDGDAGVAHARHLGVELALDLGRRRSAPSPRRDEVLTARARSAPSAPSSDRTRRRARPGRPPISVRWTPTPRAGASASIAAAAGRSAQLPSSDVLVTIPSRCARTMPREMAADHAEVVGVDDQTDACDRRIMRFASRSASTVDRRRSGSASAITRPSALTPYFEGDISRSPWRNVS